jgi:putative endonuclease
MPYFIYVLKSESTHSSYVGHTSNLEKRLVEHNNGKSLSTRGKRPWRLVYNEECTTRSEAVSRERYFKSVKGRLELRAKAIL